MIYFLINLHLLPFIQACNEDQRLILMNITTNSLLNLPIWFEVFSLHFIIRFYFVELYVQMAPLTVVLYHYGQL